MRCPRLAAAWRRICGHYSDPFWQDGLPQAYPFYLRRPGRSRRHVTGGEFITPLQILVDNRARINPVSYTHLEPTRH